MEDNAGARVSPDTLQRVDALINRHTVAGARYSPATQAEIDLWRDHGGDYGYYLTVAVPA